MALFVLWIAVGMVWLVYTEIQWSVWECADFVVSSLTGAGYQAIPSSDPDWQYAAAALYSTIGVPLMAITIGLAVSSFFEPSNADLLNKLFADITQKEIELMQDFGIDDGDGQVDCAEFIILMVVRIGKATPELIMRINERFKELNRKKNDPRRIHYDDIIRGRRHITPEMRKKMFERGLSSITLHSFADAFSAEIRSNRVQPEIIDELHTADEPNEGADTMDQEIDKGGKVNIIRSGSSVQSFSDVDSESTVVPRQSSIHALNVAIAASQLEQQFENCDEEKSGTVVETPTAAGVGEFKRKTSTLLSGITPKTLKKQTSRVEPDADHAFDGDKNGEDLEKQETSSSFMPPILVNNSRLAIDTLPSNICGNMRRISSNTDVIERSDTVGCLKQHRTKSRKSFRSLVDQLKDNSGPALDISTSIHNRARSNSSGNPPSLIRAVTRDLDVLQVEIMGYTVMELKSARWKCVYTCIVHPYVRLFLCWSMWLFTGALVYTFYQGAHAGFSFARGFYISVSVGVSMFWIELNTNGIGKAYTILHMLIGSVLLGSVRAAVAQSLVESKSNWYHDALQRKELTAALAGSNIGEVIRSFYDYYAERARIHVLLVGFLVLGISWTCVAVGWSFVDSLYFSISAMATGGLRPIPADSLDWMFAAVGMYVSLGAPIMTVSLSMLASSIATLGTRDDLQDTINTIITEREIQMLLSLGIENDDQFIDMTEFTILILVRLGVISTDLILVIVEWYQGMDTTSSGGIPYDCIKRTTITASTPLKKRVQSMISL
eukprot:CAMPEP_0185028594 /NCGR_PEP_ID=MMETSP1103-20130426/14400_1 /TAXON_ID=36769 /ORGANISM="Paraphysomonas bandaiensis, Strain Caron Lab Isolate" /LENGTH=778 /DNA_ID=CAMNT_0027563057 /DNA_START=538 /DNA_END=2874 /DNA_ORIENTATION=+